MYICFAIFASQEFNIISFDRADPLLYWDSHHGWLIQGESSAPWSWWSKDREFKSSKILLERVSTFSNWFTYIQVPSFLTAGRTLPKSMTRAVGFCKKHKMGRVCGHVWHEGIDVLETAFRLSEGVSRLSKNMETPSIKKMQTSSYPIYNNCSTLSR